MDIKGVPILVTGGGRRIGAACVLALAKAGAAVIIHYGSSANAATRLSEDINQNGGRAATLQGDLGQPEMAIELLERAGKFFGPVQILINNAAIFKPGLLADTSLPQWQEHISTNLTAPFLLMQGFARQLPAGTPGKIINFIDQRISRPRPGHIAYTTAKSALLTLTKIAAQELAPQVQVNAIAPGPILPAALDSQDHFAQIANATPLARAGTPDNIVQTLLFLLEHEYITGEMIRVDGGEHLR